MRQWIVVFCAIVAMAGLGAAARQAAPQAGGKQSGNDWQLPPDADSTKNPLPVDAKLLASGKAVFKDKCQRCHGPAGLGDGPDGEPESQEDMDLTVAKRAARNSDGVVFYKVWNGRKKPKMPTFKDELTKEQVWSVVAYVQTLRRKS